MDRELACEVVKDLLPNYVEGMVSDVSKQSIEKHLAHCTACNEVYRNMSLHLEMEQKTQPSEFQDVKRFLKKTKWMYVFYGFRILSFVSILVCIIVDLALNKKITWSLIPGCSIILANAFLYVFSSAGKHKDCAVMAVLSIGTACLLSVIQVTRYYLMDAGTFWIFRYGFPILSVWLAVLWIPVLMRKFLKWNIWDCTAWFLLLAIAGNYLTKLITGDYVWNDVLHMRGFIGNVLGELTACIFFAVIGRIKKFRI